MAFGRAVHTSSVVRNGCAALQLRIQDAKAGQMRPDYFSERVPWPTFRIVSVTIRRAMGRRFETIVVPFVVTGAVTVSRMERYS